MNQNACFEKIPLILVLSIQTLGEGVGGGLILIRLLISLNKTNLSMYDFAYFRFKNVQSRVDQTMPKAMVAATHWFFFIIVWNLSVMLIYIHSYKNTRCMLTFRVHVSEYWWGLYSGWLCTSITCWFIHFLLMNLQILESVWYAGA